MIIIGVKAGRTRSAGRVSTAISSGDEWSEKGPGTSEGSGGALYACRAAVSTDNFLPLWNLLPRGENESLGRALRPRAGGGLRHDRRGRRLRSLVIMRSAFVLICVALAAAGCSRPAADSLVQTPPAQSPAATQTAAPTPAQQAAAQVPMLDACTLLTSEEIAEAQGAAVRLATPSTRIEQGIPIAQCYFALPTAADSLSLIVYKKPAQADKMPKELWNDLFHVERAPKTGRDGKPKQQPNPQKIEGVGDEAFWGGGQFGGTLHVLKGEDVFQLSVGGPGDEAAKVESLKRLAAKIVERL